MNLKGGVGKTTLCANVSRALLKLKPLKVLLVDTDPQSSLSLIFMSEEELNAIPESDTFYDFLCNSTNYVASKADHCIRKVYPGEAGHIDLLPSHIHLIRPMIAAMAKGVGEGTSQGFEEMGNNFRQLLDYAKGAYDLVVLDTNPSGNIATFLAIKNADFILAPVTNDRFSVRGVSLMREVFEKEFEWLRKEPFRLVPIINNVEDDRDAVRVRDQLYKRAKALGDQALIHHVPHSGFLHYNEKKEGFAVDRPAHALNRRYQDRLSQQLFKVAEALVNRTKVTNEPAKH